MVAGEPCQQLLIGTSAGGRRVHDAAEEMQHGEKRAAGHEDLHR
jgi:hypothetical protein